MSANPVLPGNDFSADAKAEALQDDVLHQSERTVVVRQKSPDGTTTVIVKKAIGVDAVRRLRHEKSILQRLSGIDGVTRLAPGEWGEDAMALRDNQGTPLSQVIAVRRLSTDEVLQFARQVSRTLAAVHKVGVVHKDINPSNVLLCGPQHRPVLIDFNIATGFGEERSAFAHETRIAGTMAYMAPEQTGRTGRSVDPRSDLYSLGVLLFQLVAGRPLFESDDVLELLRHQLTTRPPALADVVPGVPPTLSAMVQRLLEKEPDRRYQSAEGLACDIERLIEEGMQGRRDVRFPLGERDFASRLLPPSRLIGREKERAVVRAALQDSMQGAGICLFVSGRAGAGKTSLVDELRTMLTESSELRGWFAAGQFDAGRHNSMSATVQAFGALGKLLLAEPEMELQTYRKRLLEALGSNLDAGLTLIPEFGLLLGERPRPEGEPVEAERRMLQSAADALGCIASPDRPLVFVLDDLHAATEVSIRFVDLMMSSRARMPGLLLVMTYRPEEIQADSLLQTKLREWQGLDEPVRVLGLEAMSPDAVSELVGEMLRLAPQDARHLGNVLSERSRGNPQETIEFINALRADGLLTPGTGGWQWDEQAIRRYVGEHDGVDLLSRRLDKLPDDCISLMEAMACLGGELSPKLLNLACDSNDVMSTLAPAVDDGLIVVDADALGSIVRLRNSRLEASLHKRLESSGNGARLRLALARRLIDQPAHSPHAARQYVAVVGELTDPQERRRVAALLHETARTLDVTNYAACDGLLAAALTAIESMEAPQDAALVAAILTRRHRVLFALSRFDEVDALYARIAARFIAEPLALAMATGVQVQSLSHRQRWPEAQALGLEVLGRLGLHKPTDMSKAIGEGLREVRAWALGDAKNDDFERPEADDLHVMAMMQLVKRVMASAFVHDKTIYSWLTLVAHQQWVKHGPSALLMPSITSIPLLILSLLKDYQAAYAVASHAVEVGRKRGFANGTPQGIVLKAMSSTHWCEPMDNVLTQCRDVMPELLRVGDTEYAALALGLMLMADFECANTLESAEAQNEACIVFDLKHGLTPNTGSVILSRQMENGLRGLTVNPSGFGPEDFDDAAFLELHGNWSSRQLIFNVLRGFAALFANDMADMRHHAGAALSQLYMLPGYYLTMLAHLCQAIGQADLARASEGEERAAALASLASCCDWMAARAVDAPINFSHLSLLLKAEQAWCLGDAMQAMAAYDQALGELETRSRPWHRAYIFERAGRFHTAQGWHRTARPLLAESQRAYDAWGATGKAARLAQEFPHLRSRVKTTSTRTTGHGTMLSTDAVDMMAILRASQAISSETGLTQLNERLVDVLSALCGAESVLLAVRLGEKPGWYLATSLGGEPVSVEQAASNGELALSAFRYAERTREPLLVDDAVHDPRFAGDPSLVGIEQCSMLLVPVVKSGDVKALLVMQNRTRNGAFSADRLDAVSLIAGQLAVSLDNALLYASLERKVNERTADLAHANQQLERLTVTDALTGLANRRHFNQAFEVEWERAAKAGVPLGLAMIDIDQFKQYNDHYGHHGGDTCLKLVAETMKGALRGETDLIARYGGEEFVMLLRDANISAATAAAERMCAAVAARMEPHASALHGIVTVSIGVASCMPGLGTTAAECLAAADAALYQAKRSGRNCVIASKQASAGSDVAASGSRRRGPDAPNAEQCLTLITSRGSIGFVRWDARRTGVFVSTPASRILGCEPNASMRLSQLLRLVRLPERARIRALWQEAIVLRESRLEMPITLAKDATRRIRMTAELSYSISGRLTSFLLAAEDVSRHASVVKALSESQDRLREAQSIARLAYWEWDYAAERAKFAPGALRMLRRPEDWTPTLRDLRELAPEDQRDWVTQLVLDAHLRRLPTLRYEVTYSDPDGSITSLHTVAKFEYDAEGKPSRFIAAVQDVSEVKSYRKQLHALSFFDPLTRLPNRAMFVERLREACAKTPWKKRQLGLLMLDIDRFKDVNDSLGHPAGDALLQQVAERLRHALRGYDTVSRLGGDEFAVVLPDVRQPSDMDNIANKVLGAFVEPFHVGGQDVFISSSIGGAMYPSQAEDVDQLLQFSDSALYHAKSQGRNNFQYYARELTDRAAGRMSLESELRKAMERGELELYFQPKLELSTGRLIGAEALMRWNHPMRGLVPPLDFIPLAEETGLIVPMGTWAIEEACRRAAQWNERVGQPLKVAVNLSVRQLTGGNLGQVVRDALKNSGCKPEWLELEITESLLLEGRDDVHALLREVADLGITIAIDDFGIGYSALSYLTRFPIHILKIDRSFVQQITEDHNSAELVKAIVSLGKSLGMELVAEGVETKEQADYLNTLGCHVVQGYLYGKPVPKGEFGQFMLAYDSKIG